MSTNASPKPTVKSLQKRLKSLHNRYYNLAAHLLSIHREAGVVIKAYAKISRLINQGILSLRYPTIHCQYWPSVMSLNGPATNAFICMFRSDLKELEKWMCGEMKTVRELRMIGELERELDRWYGGLILKIASEIEEEIRKVESEVAVGMADKILEKTRRVRIVGLLHPFTGSN